jgi:hypothetical protein
MTLNECHLPDEYVDAMVSYDSSGSKESTPPEDLIGSLVTFPWFGSNGKATKKTPHATNNFDLLKSCHLPDEYDEVVIFLKPQSQVGEMKIRQKIIIKQRTYEETQSSNPSRLLDLFMLEALRFQLWAAVDEKSQTKTDDSNALSRRKVSLEMVESRIQ